MVIPYRVDVPFDHRPVMNWLVFAGVILVFCLQVADFVSAVQAHDGYSDDRYGQPMADSDGPDNQATDRPARETQVQRTPTDRGITDRLILKGWGIRGLFGYMWLHGGLWHLMGNLIFLWLFGNAVCSKIGNVLYLPVYVGLGLVAAICHLLFVGGSMLGASGAINGIVGMYLVFFPENSISCFFWLLWYPVWFSVSGYWIITAWFLFDLLRVFTSEGQGGVAYVAHVGGFATGFALAILMLKMKWIVMERDERSLLMLLGLEKTKGPQQRGDLAYWQRQLADVSGQSAELETIPPAPEISKDDFIWFRCFCGQKIKVAREHAGRIRRCPGCSKRVKVPQG